MVSLCRCSLAMGVAAVFLRLCVCCHEFQEKEKLYQIKSVEAKLSKLREGAGGCAHTACQSAFSRPMASGMRQLRTLSEKAFHGLELLASVAESFSGCSCLSRPSSWAWAGSWLRRYWIGEAWSWRVAGPDSRPITASLLHDGHPGARGHRGHAWWLRWLLEAAAVGPRRGCDEPRQGKACGLLWPPQEHAGSRRSYATDTSAEDVQHDGGERRRHLQRAIEIRRRPNLGSELQRSIRASSSRRSWPKAGKASRAAGGAHTTPKPILHDIYEGLCGRKDKTTAEIQTAVRGESSSFSFSACGRSAAPWGPHPVLQGPPGRRGHPRGGCPCLGRRWATPTVLWSPTMQRVSCTKLCWPPLLQLDKSGPTNGTVESAMALWCSSTVPQYPSRPRHGDEDLAVYDPVVHYFSQTATSKSLVWRLCLHLGLRFEFLLAK